MSPPMSGAASPAWPRAVRGASRTSAMSGCTARRWWRVSPMPTIAMRGASRWVSPGATGLGSRRLDHAHRRPRGHDAREREAGTGEERAVLDGRPLVAPGEHQHLQVGEQDTLGVRAPVDAFRNDPLDEQESPVPRHRAMAVPQDREATLVVPVVDDPLEEVGVA